MLKISMNRPWSEIGTDVSDKISVKNALEAAGLDFSVEVVQGYYKTESYLIPAQDYYYIVRSDVPTVLGSCGKRFKPLQNDVLVDIAQPFIDSGKAVLDTIGQFNSGAKIWILLKLTEHQYVLSESETLDHYLLLMNGHDGSTSVQLGIIPFRLACANMLPKIGKHMVKFYHTANVDDMLQFFKIHLTKKLALVPNNIIIYKKMISTNITVQEATLYFRRVLNLPTEGDLTTKSLNIVNRLIELFESGTGNSGSTLYDAFNAVTEYYNYEVGRSQETRLNSLWFGANNDNLYKAQELLQC